MSLRIVVGVNWGDEGKGRMVDYFARNADFVIRYQGGNNAGHTIENEFGNFKLHLVPSGIFYRSVVNILGPGTVVNLEAAVKEMRELRGCGIAIDAENYKISDRAVITFPFHLLQDEYEEQRLSDNKFGSTKQGIAPVYGDRYMKYGVQVGALFHPDYLKQEIGRCLDLKNRIFERVYGMPPFSVDAAYGWAMEWGEILKPHVCDTLRLFKAAPPSRNRFLLEGQLGSLRDVIYGIYPYPTSSSTIAGFGTVGAGYFGRETPVVTGVMKAFSTCVGEGPFVTEISGDLANQIRETAFEYGASTGRPRRIGHFDAVASKYGIEVGGATEVALTKLDSLSGLNPLKICTGYRIGGRIIDYFPIVPELVRAEPVYMEMPGWREDIASIRRYDELPMAAQAYVEKLEHLVQCPVKYVSVGPAREAMILR
jgi:adenylosuccinate synthase